MIKINPVRPKNNFIVNQGNSVQVNLSFTMRCETDIILDLFGFKNISKSGKNTQ